MAGSNITVKPTTVLRYIHNLGSATSTLIATKEVIIKATEKA
jgi:hypothetical protein